MKHPHKHTHLGCIEDRLITPYIRVFNIPAQRWYIEFPLVYDNDYQKTRWYSDEMPLTEVKFERMCRGNAKWKWA